MSDTNSSHVPEDKTGPSSSEALSLDDEARQLCQAFKEEDYNLDEIATAVCDGGLSDSYEAYLQKFKDYSLQVVPRTWINAPESQEYQERKARFDEAYLEHLRRVRSSPFDFTKATAFLDLKVNERMPHGGRDGERS